MSTPTTDTQLALARRIEATGFAAGYSTTELADVLRRLHARVLTPDKGEYLAHEGNPVHHIGLVLEGNLHVSASGLDSDPHLMRVVRPGEFIGASLLFRPDAACPADVVAFSDSAIVAFDIATLRAWQREPDSRPFFDALGRQIGEALVAAWQKSAVLSCPNIAERVLLYLALRARKEGTRTVVVPGTESDFASYLGVNAAALSRVLNQLRADGRLTYHRNVLTLPASPHK